MWGIVSVWMRGIELTDYKRGEGCDCFDLALALLAFGRYQGTAHTEACLELDVRARMYIFFVLFNCLLFQSRYWQFRWRRFLNCIKPGTTRSHLLLLLADNHLSNSHSC